MKFEAPEHTLLAAASTIDEVTAITGRLSESLGCDTFALLSVQDRFNDSPVFESWDNVPEELSSIYCDLEGAKSDPVMQHAKTSSLPLVWGKELYVHTDRLAMWNSQAEYGYRSGVITAMHMPRGQHLVLGFERRHDEAIAPSEAVYLSAMTQLHLVHIHAAVDRIRSTTNQPLITLTPRQLECLKWTMEGKTAWEVSVIVGIAERTVVQHLQSAMKALNCSTKQSAVLKAISLGLIY